MCWVALDRAAAFADRLDASDRVEAWKQTQDQIREAILTRGWSDRANAFTQSFGSDELDASSLMLPLVGFLPADDPECWPRSTPPKNVSPTSGDSCTATGPTTGSRARKARSFCAPLAGPALARAGQPARARTVFERAAAFVNDVHLLAEEVDPVTGEFLGNFPQAFSHIGLVDGVGHLLNRTPTAPPVERCRAPSAPPNTSSLAIQLPIDQPLIKLGCILLPSW